MPLAPPGIGRDVYRIPILSILAISCYLPALRLPFISDDYTEIPLARRYSAQGWIPLWHDLHFRTRATHMLLSATLDHWFGFTPVPFYAASLILHAMCVILAYAVLREIHKPSAFWAAAFFAIYEGHQEAVMWIAASSEELVFLCGMACCLCWLKWIRGRGPGWYFGALAAFILGAASKESIWVFPFLMLLPLLGRRERVRHRLAGILPFLAFSVIYCAWIWLSGRHFSDSRFSFSSPWFLVLARSYWRMMFIWGLVAVATIAHAREAQNRRILWIGSLWMVLGLVPFSFLTYMPQVPSRHTYLASAGLALLAGTAVSQLLLDRRRVLATVLVVAALAGNLEILWVKKMAQYRERAEPSELLKDAVAKAVGPLYIDCTSLNSYTARFVVEDAGGHAIFRNTAGQDKPHCFSLEYTDRAGRLVHVSLGVETRSHGAFY